MAKKNDKIVIMDSQLETVLKGFVPFIGNMEDLHIVKALEKLHRKLRTIDNVAFRKAQKDKTPLTSKMREIQQEEQHLTRRIAARNFDF